MTDKKEESREIENKGKENSKKEPVDIIVESHHSVSIGGTKVDYTVNTGIIILKEENSDRDKEAEDARKKLESQTSVGA